MASSPATLRDVATLAGVSAKTVSRVVNDEPGVSPATHARVTQAMETLGYTPDPAARRLRSGRSGVIGLAIPELDQPFFAELADRITTTAAQHGLAVVLGVTGENGEYEADFLARHTDLDGIILYWQGLTPATLTCEAQRRPVVLLGENELDGVDRVTMGNEEGIRLALTHLLALGRRRIAAIGVATPCERTHGASITRTAALHKAAAELGYTFDEALLIPSVEWRRQDGAAAVQRLLTSGRAFDAILAFNDGLALGALHELADAGMRVPEDVAVTGFDNLDASRFSLPSLTTISPRLTAYADDAVAMLRQRLADPSAPPHTIVEKVSLLPRDSTIGGGTAWAEQK